MAWTDEIDPTQPSAVDPASQGDDQIRELKRALIERLVSRLVGFPEIDPLAVLAADVGTLGARPAAPAGDGQTGQLYIAYDTNQLFFGRAGVWYQLTISGSTSEPTPDPDGGSGVDQPTNVAVANISACASEVPTYQVRVTWTTGEAGATTRLYVDGVYNSEVAAGIVTKDITLTGGAKGYIIGVRHVLGGVLSPLVNKSITITNPCTDVHSLLDFDAIRTSTCEAGPTPEYKVTFTFRRWNPGAKVKITYDGTQILLLNSTVASPIEFELPAGGEVGVHTFEGFEVVDGVSSTPITRSLTITNPCTDPDIVPPTSFDVDEDGNCVGPTSVNEARITWVNPDPTIETKIYREHLGDAPALLATVGAGVTSYVDTTVVTGETYYYWATAWDDPDESIETGSVVYIAEDLCEEE